GGFTVAPTLATVAWPYALLTAAGVVAAAGRRETHTIPLLVAAAVVEWAALAAAACSSHAATPYLAVKMFYLAIYPMSVGAAVLLANLWRAVVRLAPRLRGPAPAWTAVLLGGAAAARPSIAAPRPGPVITEPGLQAAEGARTLASPNFIGHLTPNGCPACCVARAVCDE